MQGVVDALVEAVGLLTLGSVHLAEQLQGLLVGRESFLVVPQVAQSVTGVAQTICLAVYFLAGSESSTTASILF